MKKLCILLAFFIIQKTYSQNIELQGTVEYYDMKPTGKIYFAVAGKKFNSKDFVLYDKKKKYKFSISIAKIKQEKIASIVFAYDTTQNTNDEYACIQKINVGEIVNATEFKLLKNIKLRNDLMLNNSCTASVLYEAEKELGKFLGSYKLISKDTVRLIRTENIFYKYTSQIITKTINYTNEEFGRWGYDYDKKTLTFYIWYEFNATYGLYIRNARKYTFNVLEENGELKFINKDVELKKL
jgi:hypothetical protein